MAKATPVIFPVPTREALMVKAWNGETPESPSLFLQLNETFQEKDEFVQTSYRMKNIVLFAKSKIMRIYVHKILFPLSTIVEIHSISCPPFTIRFSLHCFYIKSTFLI